MQVSNCHGQNQAFTAIKIDDKARLRLFNSLSDRAAKKLKILIEREQPLEHDIFITTKTYGEDEHPYWTHALEPESWDFLIKAGDKEFIDNSCFISTLGQIKRALKYVKIKAEVKS